MASSKTTLSTTQVYTDDHRGYTGLQRPHETVKHSVSKCARASPYGVESFWANMKRDLYHHWSVKHLDRYVTEFEGRHNARPMDTAEQMTAMAQGAVGKRLSYSVLIGPRETRQPTML